MKKAIEKPKLEEVKEKYANAEIVSDAYTGEKFNMNEYDLKSIELGDGVSSDDYIIYGKLCREYDKILFDSKKGYAKILTYKKACGIETEPEYVINESEEELWLPVHNYNGFYEVSNMGNVRSLSRKVKHSKNPEFTKNVFGRLLSKSINPQGYNKVGLSMYGKNKTHLVYHLVSEAFLGHTERNEFVCVDHIDEDKTNDKASNLQIITKQQNTKKSFDYKLDQFKEGDYWFHNTGDLVLISEVTKLHGGTIKCKHINNTEHFAFHGICVMDRKATPEEVTEALTKEAVKRGYTGNYIYMIEGCEGVISALEITDKWDYDGRLLNILSNSTYTVFKDGIWAEIIPTIKKEDAEKQLGKKILN